MSEILVGIDTIRETRDPELRELERARIDRRRASEQHSWRGAALWFLFAVGLGLVVGLIVRNW